MPQPPNSNDFFEMIFTRRCRRRAPAATATAIDGGKTAAAGYTDCSRKISPALAPPRRRQTAARCQRRHEDFTRKAPADAERH